MTTISAETVRGLIVEEMDALKALLLAKNRDYGNSALDPVRVFSQAVPVSQLEIRIDDKLSRIQQTSQHGATVKEDTLRDLIGYLVLYRIALRLQEQGGPPGMV